MLVRYLLKTILQIFSNLLALSSLRRTISRMGWTMCVTDRYFTGLAQGWKKIFSFLGTLVEG
jgi:hypothetical protein